MQTGYRFSAMRFDLALNAHLLPCLSAMSVFFASATNAIRGFGKDHGLPAKSKAKIALTEKTRAEVTFEDVAA